VTRSVVNAHVALPPASAIFSAAGTARLDWAALNTTLALGPVIKAEFIKDLAALTLNAPLRLPRNSEIRKPRGGVSIDPRQATQMLSAMDPHAGGASSSSTHATART